MAGRPAGFSRRSNSYRLRTPEAGTSPRFDPSPQTEKSSKRNVNTPLVQKAFTVSKLTCDFLTSVALRMPVAIVIRVFEYENQSVLASTIDIVDPDQLQILLFVELPAARRISLFF
jgi:hypothetical protein